MGNASKGKRYTEEEKSLVLDYVGEVNVARGGRGGITAACNKFGVTQMTISNWIKERGGIMPGRTRTATTEKIIRLGVLHKKILRLEEELKETFIEYKKLKKEI